MPRVEKTITINVPISNVYGMIVNQPERMVEWWPPIELQERVTPPPTQVGSISRYVYNMLGVKIKGQHRVEILCPDERLYVRTISGIDSAFNFVFVWEDECATRLTVTIDYQLPGALLGQLFNKAMIESENGKNLETGLDHLKEILERENAR